jgi:signal peptidase I
MSNPKPAPGTKIVVQHGQSSLARTLRETVESIVIAFVLAFLFRTFEAEAFVIPTGSMAPTLQGRHKDVDCPKCGYRYRVSASQELDESGNPRADNCHVVATTCPMCRYTLDLGPDAEKNYPSYNGDRIIVSKFAYDLEDPHRWDVVVFKYPEDAKTNYIKRLIGMPNERIQILEGDIYTAPLGSKEFGITRKPPEKVRHMLQPVYDNDYVVPELIQAGVPPRWQPWTPVPGASPWKPSADFKSFEAESAAGPPAWLRYLNIVPNFDVWAAIENGRRFSPPKPERIDDFYAYNSGRMNCGIRDDLDHWVGDLSLGCELSVTNNSGAVILELVKGGRQFRCAIDVATGNAALSIVGKPDFAPTAITAVRGPGTHQLSFANVDEELFLWVDGKSVAFNSPTTYEHLHNSSPVMNEPVPGSESPTDLAPVGIAVDGGAAVRVNHLTIDRDVYYTADPSASAGPFIVGKDQSRILDLEADQYFMLGDNSPQSKDGRFWSVQNFVGRELLIGKALFVYWPHSFNYVEIFGKKITVPFWPNFSRMRFVH